jgi:hypothetical protein
MQAVEEIKSAAERDVVRGVVTRHYRDPRDVRLILRLSGLVVVFASLLVLSLAGNAYQHVEKPDRIVVDKDSGRVVVLNDREYGATENVELGPDKITEQDKKYVAGEWVNCIFRIDPASRDRDVVRALKMMVPEEAPKFAEYLTKNRVLEHERKESQQAVWTAQDVSVDARDPWTVRLLGEQELTRNLPNSGVSTVKRQFAISLKLVADPKRRDDRNLRSGVLVARVEWKEISSGSEGPPQ